METLFSKEYREAVKKEQKTLKRWEKTKAPEQLHELIKPASEDVKIIEMFKQLGRYSLDFLICIDYLVNILLIIENEFTLRINT